MKPFFSILLLSAVWLITTPVQSAAPSADDFLPPVEANTPEQQQQREQVKGSVQEVKDSATGQTVTTSSTPQDAINHIVNKHSQGSEPYISPGSSCVSLKDKCWVATGMTSYAVMENPTATRIAKRNAYVRAFLESQKILGELLGGSDTMAKLQSGQDVDMRTDDKSNSGTITSVQQENLEQSGQKLLKGFVVYNVHDDTTKHTVYVSIVTTPKTRGDFARPTSYGLEASSIHDGLQKVLAEINNGLIPPVGGKIIKVPATGEYAFIGFGSDVIRSFNNATLQVQARLTAARVADMRAKDALVGILIGDDTSWKNKLDESTRQLVQEFGSSDNSDDPSSKNFNKDKEEFLNKQQVSSQISSARKGQLPPGVMRKNFSSKDEAEEYAIAVYIPAVSQQARQLDKEMGQVQLLGNPNEASSTASTPAAQNAAIPRPSNNVAPGPSGQVTQDKDL